MQLSTIGGGLVMGCRYDIKLPSARERESRRVIAYLNEVGLLNCQIGEFGNVAMLDEHTRQLCKFCQLNRASIADYSLELQIWWRDHQAADRARAEKELREAKTAKEIKAAHAKLTEHEKRLLGLI
ncbi:hypothetical protein G3R49_19680 [Shewanella sp. WXL01]|uniref:hypothetical protein n=1 Tax=Shewanella sp. WXL01 TaxID=2709721 RepID=UPI0014383359|nr:hypothetical protein [Shewanella sp. WXL01]NKF52781.1 hypothetical protein [Shewanella sp. WXL01]